MFALCNEIKMLNTKKNSFSVTLAIFIHWTVINFDQNDLLEQKWNVKKYIMHLHQLDHLRKQQIILYITETV